MERIPIRFSNKGEEGAIPINATNLNTLIDEINNQFDEMEKLISKTQHITADAAGTHFTSGVYANGNELVADDDYPDPSSVTQVNNIEGEESN